MQKKIVGKNDEILFYFPEEKNLKFVPKKVLELLRKDGTNNYVGLPTDIDFYENYKTKIGSNAKKFEILTEKKVASISKIILDFSLKFNKILKLKNIGVRYFIFPWFPTEAESKKFGGVNALAAYYRTVHLYVDIKSYTKKGLLETLAHELNHIRYFENFKDLNFTIKEHLVAEGLAECFREYVVGGKVAPWSKALNKKQILIELKKIQSILNSIDRKIYTELFYGSKKFKRWTGYSIGYFLVKEFLKKNNNLTWEQIMSVPIESYFLNNKMRECA